jgi:flagellar hook-associated protein 3 FlgL
MSGRITTSMIQRNVLSDLNSLSSSLARTQAKAASGKEITRPSDNPYGTARAMGLHQSLAATRQYQDNISDARGWQDATEAALSSITDYVNVAHNLVVQAANDTSDAVDRKAIASQIDQIIQGIKETANATFGGRYLLSGTATSTPPYAMGDDDAYHGNDAGSDPATPGVLREIGPGVTMSINVVAREVLGDGRDQPTDGKLLNQLRDISEHLKADDGASLRTVDMAALKTRLDSLLEVRARNGAQSNRFDAAATRLAQVEEATNEQLSNTEDADIAKTLIDFNSQNAAYQAALRAGANIVQSSLMDFLR